MQRNLLTVVKGFMWFVCLFHVVVGLGINMSTGFIQAVATSYGATVDLAANPQLTAILHPLGAFMFILGVLAAAAALDPVKYRVIPYAFAGLFVIRGLQRIVFGEEIRKAFEISANKNLFNMVFFLLLGVTLFVLHCRATRRSTIPAAAA